MSTDKTKVSKAKEAPEADNGTKAEDVGSVKFEGTLPLEEAVSYFEAIVGGLKKGTINLKQGETVLALTPQPFLGVEVKATRKKGKEKISFEVTWRTASDSELSISSQ